MSYAESGPDSNFVINSASSFDSSSESNSESESDFRSMFVNQAFVFFSFYICTLLNKPVDGFLSIIMTESIVMQAMQV